MVQQALVLVTYLLYGVLLMLTLESSTDLNDEIERVFKSLHKEHEVYLALDK